MTTLLSPLSPHRDTVAAKMVKTALQPVAYGLDVSTSFQLFIDGYSSHDDQKQKLGPVGAPLATLGPPQAFLLAWIVRHGLRAVSRM